MALYLGAFAFTRWTMFRTIAWPRLVTAAVALALVALAPHVAALWLLVALAAALVALNIVEHRVVPRTLVAELRPSLTPH